MTVESIEMTPLSDVALFGHDPAPGLVALHPVAQPPNASQAMMRLYQRDLPSARLQTEDVPFYPFFFLSDLRLLQGFPRQRIRCKTLAGENY